MSQTPVKDQLPDHLQRIRSIVRRISRDEGRVDDIVQECCIRIIEKEHLWSRREGSLAPWISMITRRITYRALGKKRPESLEDDTREDIATPLDMSINEEQIQWVFERFRTLPQKQREVMHGKYFEGKTNAEVAHDLGVTEQTIVTHHNRALRTLKREATLMNQLASWLLVPIEHIQEGFIMKKKMTAVSLCIAMIGGGTTMGMMIPLASNPFQETDIPKEVAKLPGSTLLSKSNPITVKNDKVSPMAAATIKGSDEDHLTTLQNTIERQTIEIAQLQETAVKAAGYSDLILKLAKEAEDGGDLRRTFKLKMLLWQTSKGEARRKAGQWLSEQTLKQADDLLEQAPAASLWNYQSARVFDKDNEEILIKAKSAADASWQAAQDAILEGKLYQGYKMMDAIQSVYVTDFDQPFEGGDLSGKLAEIRQNPDFHKQVSKAANSQFDQNKDNPHAYPSYYHDFHGLKSMGYNADPDLNKKYLKSLKNLLINRRALGMVVHSGKIVNDAKRAFPRLADEIAAIDEETKGE